MSLLCIRFLRALTRLSEELRAARHGGRRQPEFMDTDVYEHVHLLRVRGGL